MNLLAVRAVLAWPEAAFALSVAVFLLAGTDRALAADYSGRGRREPPPQVIEGTGPEIYGRFIPEIDQRCRIIPDPLKNLHGDVTQFGRVAVCQSRGLYADSVYFPDSVFMYEHWR